MTSMTDVHPVPASSISGWDHEADVVIAGYGVAGAAAAVEAARAGADVLVAERTGSWGGAAAMAGGFIYLGGGTPLQKACGFEDSVDNMAAFLNVAMGPGADENRIADYCAGSVDHFDWLVDCGVPFKAEFWGEPGWEPPGDQGLMFTGGENAFPFNTIAKPAPRGHVPQMTDKRAGEASAGYMLMKPLVDTATSLGVRSVYDVRAVSLVVQSDGRVAGIIARQYGKRLAVRAHRGVVLACGSFAYNDAMVAQYAPRIAGRPAASIEQHDGQAIRMAQALGADLAHMDATEVAFLVDPQQTVRGILVNGRGQRYVPEDTYSGRIGQLTLYQQDDTAFLILDGDAQDEAMAATSATPLLKRQATWVCETVAELEREIGLPAGSLQATVNAYNDAAARGEDPLLHKKPEWVRPIGTPVGAIDLRGSTAGFTLGGLMTTLDSEVLHVGGEPIPGLYAAGRCTAGLAAWGYASGISLGDGSFYGRRAGRAAAKG
ncbi:FAD-dependent oxidoreductase [Mycobacterium xenopi]|uniref:Fumarate reductase/succinate dehydrogenase n=1 Tax=Mycobacterium xenopi TaxID=1789 RepID=A0AAD1GXZ2_MYCXE|nr:FAD-dependent oxidoreductase [Mycobacterium xenopi]MDA3639100.1 FAD-dependent oxidoreductase [Mycobacterium xenopi]MDA3657472.1 FAD-dependent oxidoreductase [Mycobacterium xenopi]MDA3661364.1 FAD-dependent oxidoreductase [Mycobacterium xenopi]ORX20695.1 flavoprotein [Mycobacterium xenopi]SPX79217.1 succinate dehydrogenase/fumarate reductase flavoprotein subunit [Mycobacterium xenopi]